MGRELKRVPLTFNWPLRKAWRGYLQRDLPYPKDCTVCHGDGLNAETRELQRQWYDGENFGRTWSYDYGFNPEGERADRPPWRVLGETPKWEYKLTRDEINKLVSEDRLSWLTGERVVKVEMARGKYKEGRNRYAWLTIRPLLRVDGDTTRGVAEWREMSVERINRMAMSQPFGGHDAINCWIAVEQRAKRLGVWGWCHACWRGKGHGRYPRKLKKAHKRWQRTEPPAGEGYQLWETVSEGSPISPVFANPDDLVAWMVMHDQTDPEAAHRFVFGAGWAPSGVLTGGRVYDNANVMLLQP